MPEGMNVETRLKYKDVTCLNQAFCKTKTGQTLNIKILAPALLKIQPQILCYMNPFLLCFALNIYSYI